MKTLIHFYSLPYLWANLAGILWFSLLLVLLLKESESLYRFTLTFFLLSTFQFLPIPLYLLLEQLFADYDFMIFNRFLYTVCFLLNIILPLSVSFETAGCQSGYALSPATDIICFWDQYFPVIRIVFSFASVMKERESYFYLRYWQGN